MLTLYNSNYKTQPCSKTGSGRLRGNDTAETISRLAFFLTSVHCFRARLDFNPNVIDNLLTLPFLQEA